MKINVTKHLYNGEGETLKTHDETVQNILARIANEDIRKYDNTKALLEKLIDDIKEKNLTVGEALKNIAITPIDDKEKKAVGDFDIYMKVYLAKTNVELNDEETGRLKEKLPKIYNNGFIIGQLSKILGGHKNPLEPRAEKEEEKA